ncbi:MAG TPA: ABC transporter permease subunit [Verrucomicrobiae bacterium]|jgi:ABC-type transport system involved in multi-copper enzyme maturation permease subunit
MFGGGVWPVVQRELRATARWPLGPWLRAGGALCGVAVFCVLADTATQVGMGLELFENIHILLLWLICALVPALTADCLARERREGTLGLLFMTPLTAPGIVVGKTMAQVLRAVMLWLAMVPILTLPFLNGGVTWADVVVCLVAELCAAMLCLAAGMLASTLTDNRALAFILAFLLMGIFIGGPAGYRFSELKNPFGSSYGPGLWRGGYPNPVFFAASPNGRVIMWNRSMGRPARPPAVVRSVPAFVTPLAVKLTIAAIVLLITLRFAGWRIEKSWQDKIPSKRQQSLVRRYCTPLFARWFADHLRRTKEWNPIAWLQQYSWKARVSKWGLCLLFVLLECAAIDGSQPYHLAATVTFLLAVLAAAYTYAGVNGFLQERRSGALELILVSPISVKEIIVGRVWGLWKQFLPSVLLLVASDFAVHTMIPDAGSNWFWVIDVEIIAIYLTLPVFATFCALHVRNLFLAAALTWMALLAAPFAGIMFIGMFAVRLAAVGPPSLCLAILVGNLFSAGLVLEYLNRNLQKRNYAFH